MSALNHTSNSSPTPEPDPLAGLKRLASRQLGRESKELPPSALPNLMEIIAEINALNPADKSPAATMQQIKLVQQTRDIFAICLNNLARGTERRPLDGGLGVSARPPIAASEKEFYALAMQRSLGAVLVCLSDLRDHELMTHALFEEMASQKRALLAIFRDPELWGAISSILLRSARLSQTFRSQLLAQESWLGWTEADLGAAQASQPGQK